MSVLSIPRAVVINIAGQCDRGKVREENQDVAHHISAGLGNLLVVAEGVGMDAAGGQASRLAIDTISSSVKDMPAFFPPEIAVQEAVYHANAAIAIAAAEPDSPDIHMGATVVVAVLRTEVDSEQAPVRAIIGNVGDSRAYLLHDRKLSLLTSNTVGQDLRDSHQITPQEAETHPDSPLLARQLGLELNVRVKIRDVPLEVGDTLLLCSDGLWRYVPEREIERILADGTRNVDEASSELLNLALDAGGHDNVAIEIARVTESPDSAAAGDSTVEPRFENQSELKPVSEFVAPSQTARSEWSTSPLILGKFTSATGLQPAKRTKMFGLIRGLKGGISNKNVMAEKPAAAQPAARIVSGVEPTVSWVTPEPIAYGTGLSTTQLNATASAQGRFIYTPGPGYVLPAGTHTLWVTFNETDSPKDNPVLASVSITVSKATPSIQWHTPSHVPSGVALSAAQLNASASVAGTFEYSPTAGEVLEDGTHTLSVIFNPKDEANYSKAQATVSVTVTKTIPEIDWALPEPISYGTPLGARELNAWASVPGTFEYSPAAGEVLPAGSHTLSATFTPNDGTTYSTASSTVPLEVTRSTPVIVWPAPGRITYGTALSDTQLNATASVPGTFAYIPGPGAVLAAGEHMPTAVFTPSNPSDYTQAQAAVSLIVAKATPTVVWPAPDPINSATPLGSAQLNASASVSGTFAYSPAAGEALQPGAHTLLVTFTPADSANYSLAQTSTLLTVTEVMPAVITWLRPSSISYGTALGEEQLNASSAVPGSFLYTPPAGDVLPPGEHMLSVTFTPEDQERYARAKATVTLVVDGLQNAGSLPGTASQASPASGAIAPSSVAEAEEQRVARKGHQLIQGVQRETRRYKGAIYEKGDDGKWHLQRK